MAESTAFTAGTANEADWALMHRTVAPDGLLAHHLSAGTGDVTVSGTVLSVAPHAAMVNGYEYTLDAAKDLDATDFGVAPTTGQSRIDIVVYEYDSSRDPEDRIQLKIKPGAAATTPTAPTLTRTADLWESEKLRYTWAAGSSITSSSLQPADYRVAGVTLVRPGQALPFAARSRLAIRGDETWVADDAAAKNTWVWRRLDDPPWDTATLASGAWEMFSGSRPFVWRFRGGVFEITGEARRRSTAGAIPTDSWSTVCTIPVNIGTSLGIRPGTWPYVSCHLPSGALLLWHLAVPTSGNITLQVRAQTGVAVTIAGISLFQIPIGV